jgi:hypothetical protein
VYWLAPNFGFLAAAAELEEKKSRIKQTFIRGFLWPDGTRFAPAIPADTAKALNRLGKPAKSPPPRGANNICRGGGSFALERGIRFDNVCLLGTARRGSRG